MREADLKKVTPEHAVIQEAIREEADGYNVFSIVRGFSRFLAYAPAYFAIRLLVLCSGPHKTVRRI